MPCACNKDEWWITEWFSYHRISASPASCMARISSIIFLIIILYSLLHV